MCKGNFVYNSLIEAQFQTFDEVVEMVKLADFRTKEQWMVRKDILDRLAAQREGKV